MADAETPPPRRMSDDFVMALRFFSRLPTGSRPHLAPALDRIAPALPFASLVIGIGPALLLALLAALGMPPLMAAALALGANALVTGGMAEDALADSADGLGGGATVERRLEIMKDSRHGTYGVVALVLSLLVRGSGLAALTAVHPLAAAGVWLATGVLGRSAGLWLAYALHPARSGGSAASAGRLGRGPFLSGIAFAAVLVLILAGPVTSLLAVVVAFAAAAALAKGWESLCRRLIGGQTGDLTGALIGLIDIATLGVFVLFQ